MEFRLTLLEKRGNNRHIMLVVGYVYALPAYNVWKGECMKKTYFVVIALVLAMVMVGCDGLIAPPKDAASNVVGYTADGRAIVELDLVGLQEVIEVIEEGARALHPLVAEAVSDFFEVIFVNSIEPDGGALSTEIYRTAWTEGSVARLQVPAGETLYNNTGTAVTDGDDTEYTGYAYIFAGRGSDKTLLGVGEIDEIINKDGQTAATKKITEDSARVNFKITALETDIIPIDFYVDGGNPDYNTFKLSGFANGTTLGDDLEIRSMDVDGKKIPAFRIDDVLPTLVEFHLKEAFTFAGAIKVADAAAEGFSSPYVPASTTTPATLAKLASVGVGDSLLAANTAFAYEAPLTFPIGLLLTPNLFDANDDPIAKADPGLCVVYFDIPVYLYDDTPADTPTGKEAVIWHFKGGLNNRLLDYGYATMSLGGGVLISVGDAFTGDTGLIISGGY